MLWVWWALTRLTHWLTSTTSGIPAWTTATSISTGKRFSTFWEPTISHSEKDSAGRTATQWLTVFSGAGPSRPSFLTPPACRWRFKPDLSRNSGKGLGKTMANSNPVADRVLGGWSLSPIFSYASGLPMAVYTGSFQEFGEGVTYNNGCQAVPINPSMTYTNSPITGYAPVNGLGTGIGNNTNVFSASQIQNVFNNFSPALLGITGRCGGAGILRGEARWNLDLGLTKDTRINERVGFQFYAQAFNVFNHMQWNDPYNAINDPGDFGALEGQYGALTLGGAGASAN